jgi:hypothetical protein
MSRFKIAHKRQPFCFECKFMTECNMSYESCNKNTGWFKPCMQGCMLHGRCKTENRLKDGEYIRECYHYRSMKI